MHDDTAGERLISVVGNLEGRSQLIGDVAIVVSRAHHIQPTVFRLETLFGAREVLRSKQRGSETVLRGASRMKALGHRAEHFLETDGLGCRQSDGPQHLLFG